MDEETLAQKTADLAGRPGHGTVSALLYEILTQALGAKTSDIHFEKQMAEVRGRADALLGRTVFEFKRDLRKEQSDAEEQLKRYLTDQQTNPQEPWVGIATDGAVWRAYALKKDGHLDYITEYALQRELKAADPEANPVPREWLAWLDGILLLEEAKQPTPRNIDLELGRHSVAYYQAASGLATLWEALQEDPDVRLKYDLWCQMLRGAYWTEVGDEKLFRQHTYLTIVAKGIATLVLQKNPPQDPQQILSGEALSHAGITGGVEQNLFSWMLKQQEGAVLVRRIIKQLRAFNFREVQTDVLKTLYESLIDPAERHDLGEYYTPDWLAERICREAIEQPLTQRVLDPSCGSGTFLFHALRRVLDTATAAGKTSDEALALACKNVVGLEIHPVAVVLASTTVILALQNHLPKRQGGTNITIPVYLADALQLNTSSFTLTAYLTVDVPPNGPNLNFPVQIAENPVLFDSLIKEIQGHLRRDIEQDIFAAWLNRQQQVPSETHDVLCQTYQNLLTLIREGRNDIWPYVIKHLARPVWLSRINPKIDCIVGNPPWVAYHYMSPAYKTHFKKDCHRLKLWVGGKSAAKQDLSAYFFARCAELYLEKGGRMAMVMPFAAMTREAYAPFRSGKFGSVFAQMGFSAAWSFEHQVQPLFKVPSCVLFARGINGGNGNDKPVLPETILAFTGQLPRRDASLAEADQALTVCEAPWPKQQPPDRSAYAGDFRNGANLAPRRFVLVEMDAGEDFGINYDAPLVRGREGRQDKEPWKSVEPWAGNIEREFLRPVLLGENIAPFRVLGEQLGVIPWDADQKHLMDAAGANSRGYLKLGHWLKQAEALWEQHHLGTRKLLEALDHYGKLRSQFPIPPRRIVYTTSGTYPAAAVVEHAAAIIDSKLYWMRVVTLGEARYLVALINSEALRGRIKEYQSQGQWGARDIHKNIFNAPIPRFDAQHPVHTALAKVAQQAEDLAATVPLKDGAHFITTRKVIRKALQDNGVTEQIDSLVHQLLDPAKDT